MPLTDCGTAEDGYDYDPMVAQAVRAESLRVRQAFQELRREELTRVVDALTWLADRGGEEGDGARMCRRLDSLGLIISQCSVTGAEIPIDLTALLQQPWRA